MVLAVEKERDGEFERQKRPSESEREMMRRTKKENGSSKSVYFCHQMEINFKFVTAECFLLF